MKAKCMKPAHLYALAIFAMACINCSDDSAGTPVVDSALDSGKDMAVTDKGPIEASTSEFGADMAGASDTSPDGGSAPSAVAVAGGSTQEDRGHAIAMDSAGNRFVTGYVGGNASLGGVTIPAAGPKTAFVAKLDSKGVFQWAAVAGGTGQSEGNSIALDGAGNIYITGIYFGSVTIGSTTLPSTSSGYSDVFVAKLDGSGKFLWAMVLASGAQNDIGSGIAADSAGNTTVGGAFWNKTSIGGKSYTATSGYDLFVARLDSSGKVTWSITAGSTETSYVNAVALDGAGNITICGAFGGTMTAGSTKLTVTSTKKGDVFAAKLDSSGKFLWAVGAGSTGWDVCRGISTDSAGVSHITGYIDEAASFGSFNLTTSGVRIPFVAKLDKDGKFLWAAAPNCGHPAEGTGVAVDSAGNSHVSGHYDGTAIFGSHKLTAVKFNDVFVAKLDSSGKFTWAATAGGGNYEKAYAIALDSAGSSHITGAFTSKAGTPFTLGAVKLVSRGSWDIFVARTDSGGKF